MIFVSHMSFLQMFSITVQKFIIRNMLMISDSDKLMSAFIDENLFKWFENCPVILNTFQYLTYDELITFIKNEIFSLVLDVKEDT